MTELLLMDDDTDKGRSIIQAEQNTPANGNQIKNMEK
jgi:hypothetical protein